VVDGLICKLWPVRAAGAERLLIRFSFSDLKPTPQSAARGDMAAAVNDSEKGTSQIGRVGET